MQNKFTIFVFSTVLFLTFQFSASGNRIKPFHSPFKSDTIHRESHVKEEQAHHELKKGYYLVIGVFDHHVNAIRMARHAMQKGLPVSYGYVHDVMRYYVYTFYTTDYETIKSHKNSLHASPDHKDAWILKYLTETNTPHTVVSLHKRHTSKPTSTQNSEHAKQTETTHLSLPDSLYKTYNLFVKVTSASTGKPIHTKVKLINTEKAKLLTTFDANTAVKLHLPKAENQNIEFDCNEFGFQKLNMHVNLEGLMPKDSLDHPISMNADTIHVNIKLKPYKKGDLIVLYNVYFFENSALIRPISKSQLHAVYDMLASNPHMHVKIHGHTNGDQFAENIYLAENDTMFFQVTPKNIRKQGSAVALSNARASTIKRWLAHKGIDPKRLDVKAWGGKKRLYENPHDFNKNIRVELEVVKDSK